MDEFPKYFGRLIKPNKTKAYPPSTNGNESTIKTFKQIQIFIF